MASPEPIKVLPDFQRDGVREESESMFSVPFFLSTEPDDEWEAALKKHDQGRSLKVEGSTIRVPFPVKANPQEIYNELRQVVADINYEVASARTVERQGHADAEERRKDFLKKLDELKFDGLPEAKPQRDH
jgi:hypothetical protein